MNIQEVFAASAAAGGGGFEANLHGLVRRSAKCPPVKATNGFSPFAFLAFILISINTVMNISNNISNNNNNRNNNNDDNNNNNLFNSNNVNKAERRRRSWRSLAMQLEEEELVADLRNHILSPWSMEFFDHLRSRSSSSLEKRPLSLQMMHQWLHLTIKAFPSCLYNFGCEMADSLTKK